MTEEEVQAWLDQQPRADLSEQQIARLAAILFPVNDVQEVA